MDVESRLRAICNLAGGPFLRPFRPNPNWKEAQVLIIGNNPATPLDDFFASFDAYWDALTRHPEVFEQAYAAARERGDSKTTQRVRELCRHLSGINYLITNAAAYPVGYKESVPAMQWKIGEEIFRLLFAQCQPRAIFAHGSKAQRMLENVFGTSLDPFADPYEQNQQADGCLLLCAPHLSGAGMPRGATFPVERALPRFAARIREAVR